MESNDRWWESDQTIDEPAWSDQPPELAAWRRADAAAHAAIRRGMAAARKGKLAEIVTEFLEIEATMESDPDRAQARLRELDAELEAIESGRPSRRPEWIDLYEEAERLYQLVPISVRPPHTQWVPAWVGELEARLGGSLGVEVHRLYWLEGRTIAEVAAGLGISRDKAREALGLYGLRERQGGCRSYRERRALATYQTPLAAAEPAWNR